MNKIKAKVSPYDNFSPWEESFINLVRRFDPSAPNRAPLKRQYLTIDGCKGHQQEKVNVSKRELGRSILNLSKINLRSFQGDQEKQLIIQQRSTRYQGPRITFYSKMNPNCSEKSRKHLNSLENKSLRSSFYQNQPTFMRDQSIKYLDILQENNEKSKSKETFTYFRSLFPIKDQKDCIYPRKKQQSHHNMKRLKIIANNRKLSHQH